MIKVNLEPRTNQGLNALRLKMARLILGYGQRQLNRVNEGHNLGLTHRSIFGLISRLSQTVYLANKIRNKDNKLTSFKGRLYDLSCWIKLVARNEAIKDVGLTPGRFFGPLLIPFQSFQDETR